MRQTLVEEVRDLLAQAGFAVSEVFRQRPISFDFLARRDDQLFIVKVLTNVDSLSEEVGREMRVLARFLDGAPLLVGLKASSAPLEAGAVYVRHHIPILSFEGVRELLLEAAPPIAFAAPGGFCVRLNGELLRRLRAERGLSLGQLADVAGVSRRAISMYEAGMSATVEAAARLEEFLAETLVVPIDPFAKSGGDPGPPEPEPVSGIEDPFARAMFETLRELGFAIVPTARSPFNGIGLVGPGGEPHPALRDALLVSASAHPDAVKRRNAVLRSVSKVTERTAFFIVSYDAQGTSGVPVVDRKALKRVSDADDLVDLVRAQRNE